MNVKKVSVLFLAILLCISIGLNWNYNEKDDGKTAKILGEAAYVSNDVKVEESRYDSRKIECETAREESIALLDEILNNPASDKEQIDEAQNEKIKIAKAIENEALCEMQLKTKGYSDVIVFINEDVASVFLPDTNLSTVQTLQIQEIVASTANISPEKIKITLYS